MSYTEIHYLLWPKFYNLLAPHFKQYNNINLFPKKINIYIKENRLVFINVLSHY